MTTEEPSPHIQAAPETSTAITAAPPATPSQGLPVTAPDSPGEAATSIELHPATRRLLRECRRLDRALCAVALLLAFLLGAFAIHNSDFFLSLAAGRALAKGDYAFGTDPFSFNSSGVYWVHHSWLFDVLFYGWHALAGGAGIVMLRGLVMLALALLLLRMRLPGQSLWIPLVCLVLTLLAVSTRLPMQSLWVSYLFLALTLCVLLAPSSAERGARNAEREHRDGIAPRSALRATLHTPRYWLLPPLFALWVNLDVWFVLGPITVALYLAGDGLQGWLDKQSSGRLRPLAWTLLAGLAACFVNPHFHRAFQLPLELAYLAASTTDALPADLVASGAALHDLLRHDKQTVVMLSPFAQAYWSQPALGQSVAGLAYFPLLLLGLVSFVLCGLQGSRRDQGEPSLLFAWFFVWLVFAVGSIYLTRLIPFFAIVAGPITALNFQTMVRRRLGTQIKSARPWPLLLLGGRLATLVACGVLVYLAWPGWLHGGAEDPRRSRRVRFEIDDPQFGKAAARLEQLHKLGTLKHGCNLTNDTGNQLAWFAGAHAKSFFDARLAIFAHKTESIAKLRQALADEADAYFNQRARAAAASPFADVHELFRSQGINYLVFTNVPFDRQMQLIVRRLWVDPYQWAPLYADGRTVVFGWRDPLLPSDPFKHERLDLAAAAFGLVPLDQRAPAEGPKVPEPRGFWQRYLLGNEPLSPAVHEAGQYLEYYHLVAGSWREPHRQAWQATAWLGPAATIAAVPSVLPGTLALASTEYGRGQLTWQSPEKRVFLAPLVQATDQGPAGAAVLAVRAARRAVAKNPHDAEPYLRLAGAYALLRKHEDYWAKRPIPPGISTLHSRATLRHIQYVTALHHALAIQPANPQVHELLAQIYKEMNYVDLALFHLEQVRAHADSLPRSADQAKVFAEFLQQLDKQIEQLSAEVKARRRLYDEQAAPLTSALAKAQLAVVTPLKVKMPGKKEVQFQLGLAQLAVDLLQKTDLNSVPDDQKAQHVKLQLALQMTMGQAGEWRKLDEKSPERLTAILGDDFSLFDALAAAALGHYHKAEMGLEALEGKCHSEQRLMVLAQLEKALAGEVVWEDIALLPSVPLGSLISIRPFPRSHLAQLARNVLSNGIRQTAQVLAEAAQLRCLRGLLALEQGDTEKALGHFRECLERIGARVTFDDPVAARYLRLLQRK